MFQGRGGVDVPCHQGVTELIRNLCNSALSRLYQHQPFKPIYTNQSECHGSSVAAASVVALMTGTGAWSRLQNIH